MITDVLFNLSPDATAAHSSDFSQITHATVRDTIYDYIYL